MSTKTTAEKRARFNELAARAQQELENDAEGYKRRIRALALLGYLVLALLIGTLVFLVGGSAWLAMVSPAIFLLIVKKKLVFLLGFLVYVIVRALWIRISPPEGRELVREDAPRLFDVIDDLAQRLDTARIHRVIIDEDINASMHQAPRLGGLGGSVNTLTIGLPLLMTLSEAQAKSVIAHELGHLSGNHASFHAWIYRVRSTWLRVMEAMDDNRNWGTGWLNRFFDWYAPYFNAYSFALARVNEYQADAEASELTSVDDTASALVHTHVTARLAESDFWRRIQRRLHSEPAIPKDAYDRLNTYLKDPQLDPGRAMAELHKAMTRQTDHTDTHPALADRLAALRASAQLPGAIEVNAAEFWLGPTLQQLIDELNKHWESKNSAAWREEHDKAQKASERLEVLRRQTPGELEQDTLWELAYLTETYADDDAALPLYREYNRRFPDDPDGDFALGRLLLRDGDERGLANMGKCLASRPLAYGAAEQAMQFLADRKRDYSEWQAAWDAHNDKEILAYEERESLSEGDQFIPPVFPDGWVDYLRETFREEPKVKEVWIAFKKLDVFPEDPLAIVAIVPAGMFNNGGKLQNWAADAIDVPFDTRFVARRAESKKLVEKIKKYGVQVYQRDH